MAYGVLIWSVEESKISSSGKLGNFTLQAEGVTICLIEWAFLGTLDALTVDGGPRLEPGIEEGKGKKGVVQ